MNDTTLTKEEKQYKRLTEEPVARLILELGLLHGGKIAVQAGHDDDHPRQQHGHGGQHKRTENFLGHPCSSSR